MSKQKKNKSAKQISDEIGVENLNRQQEGNNGKCNSCINKTMSKELKERIKTLEDENTKLKRVLSDDKTIINNYYEWLRRYFPEEFKSELIKVHEEMMARRERELEGEVNES